MDSIPPATATSTSPARIAASRIPVARTPDAQTLLIVSEETSFGMPALICAWRDGIWPCPAWSTWPMITCCTCSGSTAARSSAALIAIPPSSVGWSEDRPPPSLPIGVRAELRITVDGIPLSLGSGRMRVRATTDAPLDTGADTIAVGLFEGEAVAHDVEGGVLQALVDSGEAKPALRKLAVAHAGGRRWILAGLGKRDGFDAERARVAAATVVGRARELGTRSLCWELPHHVDDAAGGGFVEGTLLAAYDYRAYKTAPDE